MSIDLSVSLGSLRLPNPVLLASGTCGYGREMAPFLPLDRLGGLVPKTVTPLPRPGNRPSRTVEAPSGLLNAIGLDNDGLEAFVRHHLPYLRAMGCPLIVSIAAKSQDDFAAMAERIGAEPGISALELNISCPNVAGGIDFATDASMCAALIGSVRSRTRLPLIAKLSPNVTSIATIAAAAEQGGADAITAINTILGMGVDWRRRAPLLANGMGGLSGPAIKPIALRCVHQVFRAVQIPVIGVGGVATLDDAMEFFVAGASAVQIGTANYYDPTASLKILESLPAALGALGATALREIVGTLRLA